jgi:hypothetical protein
MNAKIVGIEPLGVRSRRLLMVIAQEPTQSLPALNTLRLVADIRITREQQDVTLALVIPLGMIMLDVFVQRPPQGALAQEDHLGQALSPAFGRYKTARLCQPALGA